MNAAFEDLFDSSIALNENEWSQIALLELPAGKGVLFFAAIDDKPIQILQAGSLRRVARARLIPDDSSVSRKTDIASLTRKIYWLSCDNDFLAQLTYTRLVHAIFEKNTKDWIQLPRISLAAIDTKAFLPLFFVTETFAEAGSEKQFGLFPTRKSAAEFCEFLNTVFVLCRNPSLLKTGRETSCSYLQMQTCSGPCLNQELKESYADAVDKAIQTVGGELDAAISEFRREMRQASEQMDFELAQNYKKKLAQLEKLKRPDFQYVHPLEEMCFLHIDKGPKIQIEGKKRKQQQLMWFKITSKGVWHLGDYVPDTASSISEFLETHWTKDVNELSLQNKKELLSLVSLQLFRSQRAGIWIDCSNGIWKEDIILQLNQSFGIDLTQGA